MAVPSIAWDLMDLSEKPITLVYDAPKGLPAELLATDGSIGIRVVKDSFCKKLISRINQPLVSTSDNFSGQPSPRQYSDIDSQIMSAVDYAVEEHRERVSEFSSSSVIRVWSDSRIKVLRE